MKMLVIFEKSQRLRHIGHLDLMRAMQRALRRSGLPIAFSQGFNPHVLLNFAAPLSVGMPGKREIMEVPLAKGVCEGDFKKMLSAALPKDLPCIAVRSVDDRHPAPMASLTAATYSVQFDSLPENFADILHNFMAQTEIPAIRKTKTGMKPCDIRPMIHETLLEGNALHMTLSLCEKATCKPDLFLQSLFEFAGQERPSALITRQQLLGGETPNFIPLEML